MVDDGQIVVLGGLIQDDLLESEQKVPGLGDIPLLGWLFRYQRTNKIKTNLMVFLHPTILKDEKTMRAITGEKYNYLRAKQMAIKEEGIQLLDDEVAPVLPEMDDFIKLPPPYEESLQRMELSSPDNLQQPPADNVDSQGTASTPVAAPANATTSEQPSELDLPPFIGEENAGSLPQ
jgi:general secretion pathway protein D